MLTDQGAQQSAERAEPSGSDAVTPKTIHKAITATEGKGEKLDPSMLQKAFIGCS